jgi:nicotinate-nucleotide--dimethylbenzimidazole phosphoribosyltransferase
MPKPPVVPALLPQPDVEARARVELRTAEVLRPTGALRRLDGLASWLAGWQRTDRPVVTSPAVVVFAADHGVARRGVSAYPQSITSEMLKALEGGAATAAVMARAVGAELRVVDVGVGEPTGDIVDEDALSEKRFALTLEAGRSAVRDLDCDLIAFGEMGIGNTTVAAAVCAALFGMRARDWVGRGTGIDDTTLARKIEIVELARARVAGNPPIEVLRRVGGAELAAIAGATLEARLRSIAVVLDGFVATAAAATLEVAQGGALDHCVAGHCSAEPGHRLLLEKLDLDPLLDLELRLGEASGALAAIPLIRLACVCVTEVATFSEWGLT